LEELTLVTEDKEYEPGMSNPGQTEQMKVTIYPGGEQMKAVYVETYKDAKIYELIDSAYKYAAIRGRDWAVAHTFDLIKEYIDGWLRSNPETVAWGEQVVVECPICHKVIDVPQYDSITRTDVLKKHIEEEHTSTFHSLMLHAVAEMEGPGGIVIDEAKARATPCSCVKDSHLCISPGIVGSLTDEQQKTYCNPMEVISCPNIKEKMTKWAESVEICKAKLPLADRETRLMVYIDCIGKELTKNGVEI